MADDVARCCCCRRDEDQAALSTRVICDDCRAMQLAAIDSAFADGGLMVDVVENVQNIRNDIALAVRWANRQRF